MPQRKTMTREELSTIIHFAPMSLVVLDRNRCLARVNKLAQNTLGIDSKYCNGEAFSQWVCEGSQVTFAKALNHAAESRWSTAENGDDWARPGTSVVALQSRRHANDTPGLPFWANVTVTACFENLPEASSVGYLHEAWYIISVAPISALEKNNLSEKLKSKKALPKLVRSCVSSQFSLPNLDQDLSPDVQGPPTPRARETTDQPVAATTTTPTPISTPAPTPIPTASSSFPSHSDALPPVQCPLSESIIHNFDYPMCAMSSDGSNFIRNRAMDGLLGVLSTSYEGLSKHDSADTSNGEPNEENISESSSSHDSGKTAAPVRSEVDTSWLLSHFKCFDETFSHALPESEYPLFKASILGQRFKHVVIGVESGDGTRRILECEGWPVYDAEGHGNFIGGMLALEDVTRKRAAVVSPLSAQTPSEHDVSQGERYWQSLWQEFPEISWIADAHGHLEWYNKRWYEFTGATPEQSMGAGWTSFVHHDDRPSASKTWSRALRNSTSYEIQERILGADGTYRWMLCRAFPYRDEHGRISKWCGTLTDIDTTLLTLAANREAKENLSDAVRVADITLWSVDTEGRFTLAEGALSGGGETSAYATSVSGSTSSGSEEHKDSLRRLGPSQAPIVGKSMFEEWGSTTQSPFERAMSGDFVTQEMTVRGRTYRTVYRPRRARMSAPTSFLLSSEDGEAQVVGVTGISFDITERLEMERKMAESMREVTKAEAAMAAAKEASHMKSQFLAVISHEIRTPLNGVVGLSELLLDIEELPAEAQDLVHAILRSSGALLSVINDVLDFSKVEAGKLDLVSVPFSLRLVCEDAVRDFTKLMSNKGLALVQDIQVPADGLLLGDAGRITQVLNNLLSNASKFTENGYVKLSARTSRVGDLGAYYTFTISDSGCGIPKHQHSFLFQPFRQADPSTSRKYGGSGLGLAICKNLIELMGGQISLESEEGKGTTVSFSIPLPNAPPARPRLATAAMQRKLSGSERMVKSLSQPGALTMSTATTAEDDCGADDELPYIEPIAVNRRESGGDVLSLRRSSVVASEVLQARGVLPSSCEAVVEIKPRILLAEDNPINSQIAIKTLCKLGYEVDHVENGAEVLDAFVTSTYDLVLMDCMMPTMDGYTATRKMRNSMSPLMRRIPVIALTAAAIKGRDLCLAAGMTDYLSKPVRRVTLDAMLKKWIGREHDEASSGVLSPGSSVGTGSSGSDDLAKQCHRAMDVVTKGDVSVELDTIPVLCGPPAPPVPLPTAAGQ